MLLAGLPLLLLGAAAPAAAQERPPQFPSEVELVTVDVVVKDKKGNPVTGLTAAEFTLLEDGQPQRVESFDEISGSTPLRPEETGDDAARESGTPAAPAGTTHSSRLSRTFVVVFDQVHLTSLQADRGRRALETFLKGALRERDRVRLVAVGSWDFEGPAEEALEEVAHFEGQRVRQEGPEALTDWEAMRIDRFDDRPLMLRVIERIAVLTSGRHPSDREGERIDTLMVQDPNQMNFKTLNEAYVKILARAAYDDAVRRNETTLGALESVLDRLAAVRGRKSVILVSPGLIKDPALDDHYRRVIDASSRANAAVYFLDVRGLEIIPGEAAEHGPMLASIDQGLALTSQSLEGQGSEILAADTGGFTVKNRNDLEDGLRRIAAETRSYYLLGYGPRPAKADGEFRRIEVKVRRRGLEVRARKGYYASLPGGAGATKLADTLRGGLSEGAEIHLRTASYVFGDAGPGKRHALVAAEADIRGLALENRDGLLHGTLDLVIEVTAKAGGPPDRFVQQVEVSLTPERRKALLDRGLPLARALELAPGEYEARFALSDPRSGRVGAASSRFEVPAEGFRLSTPILSDVMEPGADAGRDVPSLGARRRFPAHGTLYFQYEVYGARRDPATGQTAVVSGWAVRDHAGIEWARADPARLEREGGGAPGRLGQVDLTFPPGDYTLVLDAMDQVSARRVEVREPFTVEAAKP